MKRPILLACALAGVLFFINNCGNSSSTTGVSSLEALPKGTGTTTASAIGYSMRNDLQSATTGTQLDSWYTAFNGQASKSQTFCTLGLIVKEVIRAASQPDKIACYLGVMEKHASISGWPSDGADGNYHYVNLTGTGGGDGKIKFKINKTGDSYTGFEMFSGFGGAEQTEYISMATSGSTVTLTSVQYYSGSGNTHRGRVVVTGNINSSGQWTSSKSIVAQSARSESTRTENSRMELTQFSDRFQVQGYSTGTDNFSRGSFTNQAFALVQLLNPTPLSTMALGEGTAKVTMTHGVYGTFSQTRGWNGDTGAPITPATTADYYSTVDAATLPSAPSSYDTGFSAAETWDLAPPSGTTPIAVNFAAIEGNASAASDFQTCNTNYGFTEESNWPNCWSASDN